LSVGDAVTKYKRRIGVNNEQISAATGIPKSTIDKITAGTTLDPKFSTLRLIAAYLGCSVDDLAAEPKKSPPADDWGGEEEREREIRETMEIVKQLPEREQRIVLESVLGMVEALEKSRDI